MRIIVILFLHLLLAINLSASESYIDSDSVKKKSSYQLGLTPSALLNVFHGIQLNHTYYISKRFIAGLETGYLFNRLGDNDIAFSGYRIRPSIKYKVYNGDNENVSFGIFFNHRKFRYYEEVEILRANGAYKEVYNVKRSAKLNGAGFEFDYTLFDKSLSYTIGGGLGLGSIVNKYEPNFQIANSWFDTPGEDPFPIIFLHFGIGFLKL